MAHTSFDVAFPIRLKMFLSNSLVPLIDEFIHGFTVIVNCVDAEYRKLLAVYVMIYTQLAHGVHEIILDTGSNDNPTGSQVTE